MFGTPDTTPRTAETALRLRRLTYQEVPEAADLLARVFDNDPFVDWVVRSDAKREEALRRFFDVCLRQLTMPYGEVWATPHLEGIALWTPPSSFKVGLSEQIHFVGQAIRAMQLRHVASRLAGFNEVERHHPKESHYYLFFMGVDPDCQGGGIGSAMLASMLERCDAESMPAYLEATRETLIPFYSRHGYRPLAPVELPYKGPTMYPMWRDPAF